MDKDRFKRSHTGLTLKQRAVDDFQRGLTRALQRVGVLAEPRPTTARSELGLKPIRPSSRCALPTREKKSSAAGPASCSRVWRSAARRASRTAVRVSSTASVGCALELRALTFSALKIDTPSWSAKTGTGVR